MNARAFLSREFLRVYGGQARGLRFFFAPGRVNLIGEHTDYNGGHVLPVAISLGIRAAVRLSGGRTMRFASLDMPGSVSVDLDDNIPYDPKDGWANYPKGVVAHLRAAGYELPGCDVLYWSDLPIGAGLSSSASLELLTAYLLVHLSCLLRGEPVPGEGIGTRDESVRIELAKICQDAENEFVGVGCGLMDQFAVAMGRRDSALLLNCATMEYEYIPVALSDYRLVIMDTGKRRSLESSAFNQRREECERALSCLRQRSEIANLCSAKVEQLDAIPDPILKRRAKHVVSEEARTLEAARRLRRGDLRGFGELMVESHDSLKLDYEVTGPELDAIVEEALSLNCCIGARMTGAGFGGSAIALVERVALTEFAERVKRGYKARTGMEASVYECAVGDGARAGIPEVSLPG